MWIRLDDGFVEDERILGLSDKAFRLHVAALCASGRNLTDGFVSAARLHSLKALTGATQRHADELVSSGLWGANGSAWAIRKYLDYNPSGEQVREERRKASERRAKRRPNVARTSPDERENVARTSPTTNTSTTPIEQTPPPGAQSLVAEYVDQVRALGAEPAARTKGQVARQISELLSEGQPSETIRGAIGLLVERRLHPATLPTLLLEAAAGPARKPSAKGVSARDIFSMTGRQLEAGT
jgi:hypothetical protein